MASSSISDALFSLDFVYRSIIHHPKYNKIHHDIIITHYYEVIINLVIGNS